MLGQEAPQQPPKPSSHPPRLCRRLRAAGATAEDESAVVDGPGFNMASRPDLSMAARPGLGVARQPGTDGPGPHSFTSPRGRGTDLLGAQAVSVPLTDLPGLWGGVAFTPCQFPRGADEEVVMCTGIRGRPWAGEDLTTFPTSHPWGQRLGCCSL